MKDKIVIVGSGASGVHFALSVLKKGYEVHMLDVGHQRPQVVNAGDSFTTLKSNLDDPAAYFLGDDYRGILFPDSSSEYYGIPPGKDYIFDGVDNFDHKTNGFAPIYSFARGGLAETWTGGVYPFNDNELEDFQFNYKEIEPYYAETANRIGVNGEKDDLTKFFPLHDHLMQPLDLDEHSEQILKQYQGKRQHLNQRLNCYLGRSRVATLSENKNGREKCSFLGRCLWGCPSDSLYTPSITLKECFKFSNFNYHADLYVSHFKFDRRRKINKVVAESTSGKRIREFDVDKLVLAAGTLSSSKIFLESIYRGTGEIIKLSGLMDNRQVLIPFVNLKMLGREFNPNTYQYHQIALGLQNGTPKEYVHGQITTLKTGLIHPIIQNIPFDLKTSIFLFRHLHAALGILNLNFNDTRRQENYVTLEPDAESISTLVTHYSPAENEPEILDQSIKRVKKALRKLGCIVPPGMTHVRPVGASVHYAGTLPMSKSKSSLTTSDTCQSHDFENLYFADGTTYPFLPAKNITFTLMANAIRVADGNF